MTEAPHTAVLLIAHGSRRASANEDLAKLAEIVRAPGRFDVVEIAYLELAEPTIPDGGAACVARGARHVLLFPYFLSAGTHVVSDLEEHRRELAERFPDVRFTLCPPLGLHPKMAEIVFDRLAEGVSAAER